MAKSPTTWVAPDGSSTEQSTAGGRLQLQSSTGFLLLQSGGHLLLEANQVIPKPFTNWALPAAKAQSGWTEPDGSTDLTQVTGVQRKEQDGTVRRLQDGTIRTLESTVATRKPATIWGNG